MTPRQLFSAIYALGAEEAGGRHKFDELLEEWAKEFDVLEARYLEEVPESIANDMRSLMAMSPPAEKRED